MWVPEATFVQVTRHESGKIKGRLAVEDSLVLTGMAAGPVTVRSGGDLRLSGMATSGLVVKAGGRASVSGALHGTLRCAGVVELTGMLDGRIVVEPGGQVLAAEGAHRHHADGRVLVMGPSGSWQPKGPGGYVIDEHTKRWPLASD